MNNDRLKGVIGEIIMNNKEIKSLLSEQNMALSNIMSSFNKENVDEAYQRGLNEAWDFAGKINLYTTSELNRIGFDDEVFNYPVSDAMDIINKYEKSIGDELEIGDEVIAIYGLSDPFVITDLSNNCVYGFGKSGELRGCNRKESEFKKTGRHFPEIAAVLSRMRER